ncbi:MAG: hypothetical protein ACOYOB_03035 [Myxococcota bacterium]
MTWDLTVVAAIVAGAVWVLVRRLRSPAGACSKCAAGSKCAPAQEKSASAVHRPVSELRLGRSSSRPPL